MISYQDNLDIFHMLQSLRKRYRMFRDKKSLLWLDGWCSWFSIWVTNYYEIGSQELEQLPFNEKRYHEFQRFIQKKMGNGNDIAIDLVLKYCNWDDEKAFDVYFELLDEFKRENNIVDNFDRVEE
jgi:hypothetical protein